MIDEIAKDADQRMARSVENFQHELGRLRTGRAQPGILEHIQVEYYGAKVPLVQAANITVEDSRTLAVTPWEKHMVPVIEKAILGSDLGLTPMSAGQVVRVPLPALTEERRKDLVRVVKQEAEQARVAVRNIRRDANSDLKDLVKEKEITEDEERAGQERIQKLTDRHIAEIDRILESKEQELMEV